MSETRPREAGKSGAWAQATKTVSTLPENRSASLKVPVKGETRERGCDEGRPTTKDNRGRRAGWSPAYTDIATKNYRSQWARSQKSLTLKPIFGDKGLYIFRSEEECISHVVRTPDFDGSRPEWWLDFPENLFEIISPAFWHRWPSDWIFPPDDVFPFLSGEPYGNDETLAINRGPITGPGPTSDWLLNGGIWNDLGNWDDSEVWED